MGDMSPFSVMSSKRWKRHHTSRMFMELFKYISGVNKNQEEMEMTAPVVTTHEVVKGEPQPRGGRRGSGGSPRADDSPSTPGQQQGVSRDQARHVCLRQAIRRISPDS